MIVLFTDFGLEGPYIGQMKAVLHQGAPEAKVIDLFSDVPVCNPTSASYLLAAYAVDFPPETVFLAVVDPGVGSDRDAVIMHADSRWFVGPDNGVLNTVAALGKDVKWWEITWRPEKLSASFHGRDLFAPVAAMLARGDPPPGEIIDPPAGASNWPTDLARVIYIDHFGNAITGIRASSCSEDQTLKINDHVISHARTFSDVEHDQTLWYENANGLVEIAVNKGRADHVLDINIGDAVTLE